MACGIPVVATSVGAVTERVKDLRHPSGREGTMHGPDQATGFLVPPERAETMAEAAATLLSDPALGAQLGANAAREAGRMYRARQQAEAYVTWFEDILRERKKEPQS
jgi:glycosyltransferase involved in cell wall biosynthesis